MNINTGQKGNTKIVVIVAVLVIVALAWFTLSRPKSTAEQQVAYEQAGLSEIEKDVVTTLSKVGKITIDGSVFKNPAFTQLIDLSRSITKEPIGRANPFAPIDTDAILQDQQDTAEQDTAGASTDNATSTGTVTLTPREN